MQTLILEGLSTRGDPSYRLAALKALAAAGLTDVGFPAQLVPIYQTAAGINQKIELLAALKDIQPFDPTLYNALASDLDAGQEWLAIKILQVLQGSASHTDRVLQTARQLQKSESTAVRNATDDFFHEKK